jgi:hypothetical protein
MIDWEQVVRLAMLGYKYQILGRVTDSDKMGKLYSDCENDQAYEIRQMINTLFED